MDPRTFPHEFRHHALDEFISMTSIPAMDRSADLLGSLMRLLGPSLALYIADSGIWSRPGPESLKLALADLCTDLRSIVERSGVLLDECGIPPPQVEYPIRYTALHDIDLGWLVPQLLDQCHSQESALDALASAAETSSGSAAAVVDLLREARTTLQSHIDVLDQLRKSAGTSAADAS